MFLGSLATGIFINEFNSDSGVTTPLKIESWLAANTGQLSARLADDLTGVSLTSEQESIFTLMYLSRYYGQTAQSANSGVGAVDWITIREGDSTVTRTNKNEVAKSYLAMRKQTNEELDKLIAAYHLKYATAQQVAGDDTLEYPYYSR